jgi:hypothetical protein
MSGRTAAEQRLLRKLSLFILELKVYTFISLLERHYNPDQPRVPAGSPDGGEWMDGGGSGYPARARLPRGTQRIALAARLIGKRLGFGDERVIVHCYYRDMLGNDFTIEQDATLECRPTWPTRPTG